MSFRLFGVDVEIQASFWITTVIFGLLQGMSVTSMVMWTVVVFLSILVHEFGHAAAMMRHGIEPSIALHGMGGHTAWNCSPNLTRFQHIVVSLAGPFAGFAVGLPVYALLYFAPETMLRIPPTAWPLIRMWCFVNVYWGLFNLLPVLPLDGGHVLEHLLGPTRLRLSSAISIVVAVLAMGWFLSITYYWPMFLLGMGALQSYQRFQAAASIEPVAGTTRRPRENPLPAEVQAILQSAKHALNEEQFDRAIGLAQQVLTGIDGRPAPAPGTFQAMEILAWAHLLAGRTELAASILAKAERLGEPDGALRGAILLAQGKTQEAREALEAARSKGDDRKEIVGPLIQILIGQNEIARASAVAYDIVESLSSDDARRMAEIALEHRVFDWSARLSQAVFERNKQPDDAYEAARALAQDGQKEQALAWLKRAKDAGFSDGARAWSDKALETLRAAEALGTVLPKP